MKMQPKYLESRFGFIVGQSAVCIELENISFETESVYIQFMQLCVCLCLPSPIFMAFRRR